MNKLIRYVSRLRDDFDTVICGVNGVLVRGNVVDLEAVEALIKLYQSGKKLMLASNYSIRVQDLVCFLKQNNVPMNIFYAMITAGEIAHFYLKNSPQNGKNFYTLTPNKFSVLNGLDYNETTMIEKADFMVAEATLSGIDCATIKDTLERALMLGVPLLCIGNNTSIVGENGIVSSAGAVAEQYAMMGGQIIPLGKPDIRIASYLVEGVDGFDAGRCLVVGDDMATDMRLGNNFKAQTLLICNGVHQIKDNYERQIEELSKSYGLNVDYCMESFRW